GGHNAGAGEVIAATLRETIVGDQLHIVIGMLANKDAAGLLGPIAPLAASLTAVPVPDHDHLAPAELAAIASGLSIPDVSSAGTMTDALDALAQSGSPRTVLILGSLYLAGGVLAANEEQPA
nr:bifunctional folylpolyglutamate synthase/dihydrofolate synthase [Pseudomonadota bacterium]